MQEILYRSSRLALLAENAAMAPDTKPSHLCILAQHEERDAALRERYRVYIARFDRWSKPKGWARFMARHPLAALVALTRGRELPPEWCRQPMAEVDFVSEIFLGSARQMGRP